jgi:hypothetical protein
MGIKNLSLVAAKTLALHQSIGGLKSHYDEDIAQNGQ